MIGEDGQGGDLGGKGEEDEFAHRTGDFFSFVFRYPPGSQAGKQLCQWIRI